MPNEPPTKKPSFWARPAPVSIAGAIIIGIICSVLYDLLVKPGLSTFGRGLLNVATLGSSTVRDSVYTTAALDPTPVPSLALLIVVASFAIGPLLAFVPRFGLAREYRRLREALASAKRHEKRELTTRLKAMKAKLSRRAFIILSVNALIVLIAVAVVNQSVLVWRIFHADLAAVAPYISDQEQETLLARFSSMQGRDDYDAILRDLQAIASKNNVKLQDVDAW